MNPDNMTLLYMEQAVLVYTIYMGLSVRNSDYLITEVSFFFVFYLQSKLNELDAVAHKLDITVGTQGSHALPEVGKSLTVLDICPFWSFSLLFIIGQPYKYFSDSHTIMSLIPFLKAATLVLNIAPANFLLTLYND